MNESKANSGRKLFFGLFIFPLMIVAGMILMVLAVVLMTHEAETPESLIAAIKTGSERKRWQKASELSNELNRREPGPRDEALVGEIASILSDADRYDGKTRAYMAAALARFPDDAAAESALIAALSDRDEEVRFYALWSLGELKARAAVPRIVPLLAGREEAMRVNAAYVLGAIGDASVVPALKPLLDDPAVDVRWNAALALARLGDASSFPVLESMTDRADLEGQRKMPPDRVESVMINAIKGLALIPGPSSIRILESLSRNDASLKVRQAAIDAIAYQKGRE